MTDVAVPTPEALPQRWRDAVAGRSDPAAIVRRPAGLDVLPLSAAQARWWHVTRADPNHPSFNLFRLHRLRGPLDSGALARAFAAVVDRQESLRLRFDQLGDLPVQVVGTGTDIGLERLDIGDLPPPEREPRARDLVSTWTDERFDVTTGPLVRARLLRLDDTDHVLCVVTHHLVADGMSLDLLIRELRAHYAAFVTGVDAGLPALAVGFGDFALWQWSRSDLLEAGLRYWLDRLADPPVLDLPTDHPRPAVKQGARSYVEHRVDGEFAGRLEALARAERCTPLVVLVAAYQALLARHSGQDDVCLLSSLSGRGWVEVEPLIGNLASFPILRGDLSGDPTFREFLVRTRTAVLGAYAHPDRPSDRLLAELRLPTDASRLPLYQTMLTLHTEQPAGPAGPLDGPVWEAFHGSYPQIFFDLTLDVWRRPDELSFVFRYDEALFEAGTIEAMAWRLECLLRGAVDDPGARLSALVLVDEQERRRLRDLATGPAMPAAPDSVLALVEAAVARTPDAIAIEWPGGEPVTYAALWAAVADRANRLRAAGAGPGRLVAITPERTPELLIAPLAAWRAGAAYVWAESIADGAVAEPVAYVTHTAGGTAVPVTHGALAAALDALRCVLGGDSADRWLAATPVTYHAAAAELFLPLLAGVRVVVAPQAALDDPAELVRLVRNRGVTHVQATPSRWRLLLDAGLSGPDITGIAGGEPLPAPLARRLGVRLGRAIAAYGCAEATLWATAEELTEDAGGATIGRPLAGIHADVLDERGQPVPIGVAGELCLSGPAVVAGGGSHRTGDRVRWLADGRLQHLGRIGDQVTVALCRVAPQEAEHRIADHPAVAQAAVMVRTDAAGLPSLVAYVVPAGGPAVAEELRRELAASLPAPLVPAALAVVERLPLTPHGRLDRKALSAGRCPARTADAARPAAG
ncbi:MAG TPA: condensation domain-containing protein [Pilimelia sp.]|nr:condensation domain-containing protein [Pilimelia sp.]